MRSLFLVIIILFGVWWMSDPAFNTAKRAYNYALANKITTSDRWIYVDFTKPSDEKRLFVMEGDRVIFSTYVTHGAGSGKGPKPTQFSNINNSHMSSIGVYVTLNTYTGKHGLSRQIKGLEFTNDGALKRSVVIHSASYIGDGKTGTSWGCFAVPLADIETILDYSKKGTLLIAYYPDKDWLSKSKFLNN